MGHSTKPTLDLANIDDPESCTLAEEENFPGLDCLDNDRNSNLSPIFPTLIGEDLQFLFDNVPYFADTTTSTTLNQDTVDWDFVQDVGCH